MLSPGPQELILIFLFILLIFGGRKIPEVARGLGKGMREFKDGMNNIKDDLENTSGKDDGSSTEEESPDEKARPASTSKEKSDSTDDDRI